jgi:hypothetical protein
VTTATTPRPTDGSHLPIVHLNGSGGQALLDQYERIVVALNAALDAFNAASPHGRDYYPRGDDAYLVARAEFLRRVAQVDAVRQDVMADWQDVFDTINGITR